MTATKKLKEYIEGKYKSLLEFSNASEIPYTTIYTILNRGIENSTVSNILKICEKLDISLDDLLRNNEIKTYSSPSQGNNDSVEEIQKALSRKCEITVDITEVLSHEFTLANGNKLSPKETKDIIKIIDSSLSRKI